MIVKSRRERESSRSTLDFFFLVLRQLDRSACINYVIVNSRREYSWKYFILFFICALIAGARRSYAFE